jgi:FkbH-like protein
MKALLLSNTNMQPLAAFLKPLETVCGEYNSLLLDLANPQSPAAAPDIDRVLCLFDTDILMGEAFYGRGEAEQCDALLRALDGFCARHPEKTVVANTFCIGSGRWLNFADPVHPASLKRCETILNERLAALAQAHSNLLLFDIERLFRRYGEEALLTAAFWYAGRIRYSNKMFRLLAATIRQLLDAYANRARKLLIVDLDNTLWGGILGEAGPLGVTLSEEGEGRIYRDFQRALKSLQQTGVLLAVCSKNNAEDADEAFEKNSMMILRREDFAARRINWQPKPDNIADIADTLSLGTDSFVFIDDNPAERDLVARTLPDVAVPEFPARIENLPDWFLRDVVPKYFGKYAITTEDGTKTRQYHAKESRQALAENLDLAGFLAELNIVCSIETDPAGRVARAAQMTQKTNQFNLTTRRYEVPEMTGRIDSSDHAVLMLDYQDRFGSEGAVGLAIVDLGTGHIENLLMSCRVIGRKVEDRLLDAIYDLLRRHGFAKVTGEYIPTRKNGLVANFYETHGFTLISQGDDGAKAYERLLK